MEELLKHRWEDRNRGLNEKFLAVQAEMNGGGILHSSIAVKAHHDVFREEFEESRHTIVSTIMDCLRCKKIKLDRPFLENHAKNMLAARRDELDSLFGQMARVSFEALQNQSMIAPFMNVAQYHDHASHEVAIELDRALDEFERELGETLKDRIMNRFLNNPVIAFGVIIAIFLATIFALIAGLKSVGS